MLPLLLSEARLLIEMLPGLSANISTGFLIFFRVDVYCPLKAMMTTAFSISASSTSCWMTRLSESSQKKLLTVIGSWWTVFHSTPHTAAAHPKRRDGRSAASADRVLAGF